MFSKPFRATEIAALGPWSSWSVRQLGLQVCINFTANVPWAFLFVWFKISKKELYIFSSTRKVWSIYFHRFLDILVLIISMITVVLFIWNQYFNMVAYIAWYNLWTWQSYQLMVVTNMAKMLKINKFRILGILSGNQLFTKAAMLYNYIQRDASKHGLHVHTFIKDDGHIIFFIIVPMLLQHQIIYPVWYCTSGNHITIRQRVFRVLAFGGLVT